MIFDMDLVQEVYRELPGRWPPPGASYNRPLTLAERYWPPTAGTLAGIALSARGGLCRVWSRPCRHAGRDGANGVAPVYAGRQRPCGRAHYRALRPPYPGEIRRGGGLEKALISNRRYMSFCSVSGKYGIGFWRPGAGIIHRGA